MPRRGEVTGQDVADLVGVDRSAVSLVLRNPGTKRVGQATKERILEAVAQLGYVPNSAAAQLREGRSRIALMPFWHASSGSSADQIVDGIADAAERHGFNFLIHGSRRVDDATSRAWASLRPAIFIADGAQLSGEVVGSLQRSGTRAIVSIGPPELPRVFAVDEQIARAGVLAAQHLLHSGADRFVAVVPDILEVSAFTRSRLDGFLSSLPARSTKVVHADMHSMTISQWILSLPRSGPRLGIFADSDRCAIEIMRAALQAGLAVPERISVVGIDGEESGRELHPAITSLVYDAHQFGRDIFAAGLALAQGEEPATPVTDYRIVPRTSS
ncbi:LacI family DNA-binding transcriptional regulator [Brachybacterium hainanense]|uniref:LacI family DNA-binding transcriptional regulator n=1 Tax=Brachybacterium hainanense TaxID=1541174 RepID=A0ABV6RCI6_9MICO